MSKAAEFLCGRLELLSFGMLTSWDRRNYGVGQIIEKKLTPEQRELVSQLKSDDLAKIAPWAIFGDKPSQRGRPK